MATLSRYLTRWDPIRAAAAGLALALLALFAAYIVAIIAAGASTGGVLAAAALIAIAGSGLLYAWRLGAGAALE